MVRSTLSIKRGATNVVLDPGEAAYCGRVARPRILPMNLPVFKGERREIAIFRHIVFRTSVVALNERPQRVIPFLLTNI